VSLVALVWAAAQVIVSGVAIRRARRAFGGATLGQAADAPSDTLLVRPIAGDERGLTERLAATGGARRVVFAVRSPDDAAVPAAEAAKAGLSGAEARLVVTGAEGPNMKACQLAHVLAEADAEPVVVFADSDVSLAPSAVLELTEALAKDPRLGAVFAPVAFVPSGPRSRGDRATVAILTASLHAFPLLAALDGGLFVGKVFAVRTPALEAVGGFGALRHVLGEDTELARRLRAARLGITFVPQIARATRGGVTLADVTARMTRWLLVVRGQRPWLLPSYPLLLAGVLPFAALVGALALSTPASLPTGALMLGAVLAARLSVSFTGRALAGIERSLVAALVDVALADLVLGWATLRALTTRTLAWRGEPLRLTGGVLSRDAETNKNKTKPGS